MVVRRGSVVLVRYPFTDLSETKVRPAVVLTPNSLLNQINDVLCLFISSTMPNDLLATDFILETSHPSFSQTGLHYSSVFRAHKLALIEKSLITRILGVLDEKLTNEINNKIRIAIGL